MTRISSAQTEITREELLVAVPCHLASRDVHLFWVDKSPNGKVRISVTAKIEIDRQMLLLRDNTEDPVLVYPWDTNDPSYNTNLHLLALVRILSDPANEDILLSIRSGFELELNFQTGPVKGLFFPTSIVKSCFITTVILRSQNVIAALFKALAAASSKESGDEPTTSIIVYTLSVKILKVQI